MICNLKIITSQNFRLPTLVKNYIEPLHCVHCPVIFNLARERRLRSGQLAHPSDIVFRFGDYVNTSVTNKVFGDFFSRPKPREAQYVAFIFPAKCPIKTELFSFISRKRVASRT